MSGAAEKILVRGVNWLGDAVMTVPALLRLREARPTAHLTLLSPEKLADLWKNHPALDAVITFAIDENVWSVAKKLLGNDFQTGLVLPNSPRSALEIWLARIPQRIGCARPWRNLLLTTRVTSRAGFMRKRSRTEIKRLIRSPASRPSQSLPLPAGHHLHHYLHLAATLGANPEPLAPSLVVSDKEIEAVKSKFNLPGKQFFLGLNPGAEYGPAKRWPRKHFVATALEIQKRTKCSWLIFGGKTDQAIADSIETELRALVSGTRNLAGKTSLRELMALLKLCRAVLTNDTGPMHVAAAVGTPVVALFGSTSPLFSAPGLPGDPRHSLLSAGAVCAPCFLRDCPIDFLCMEGVSAERVVEAVLNACRQNSGFQNGL